MGRKRKYFTAEEKREAEIQCNHRMYLRRKELKEQIKATPYFQHLMEEYNNFVKVKKEEMKDYIKKELNKIRNEKDN